MLSLKVFAHASKYLVKKEKLNTPFETLSKTLAFGKRKLSIERKWSKRRRRKKPVCHVFVFSFYSTGFTRWVLVYFFGKGKRENKEWIEEKRENKITRMCFFSLFILLFLLLGLLFILFLAFLSSFRIRLASYTHTHTPMALSVIYENGRLFHIFWYVKWWNVKMNCILLRIQKSVREKK